MSWAYQALVLRVHDGDTIEVELDMGLGVYQRTIGIRFAGVDAAELSTDEGKAARAALELLVKPGDVLTLTSVGWDKYASRIDAAPVLGAGGVDIIQAGLAAGWLKPWDGHGPKPWPAEGSA